MTGVTTGAAARWQKAVGDSLRALQTQVQRLAVTAPPVGAAVLYAGSGAPRNYLQANGTAFSSDDYPELAEVLGGTTTPTIANAGGLHYVIRAR